MPATWWREEFQKIGAEFQIIAVVRSFSKGKIAISASLWLKIQPRSNKTAMNLSKLNFMFLRTNFTILSISKNYKKLQNLS